MSTQSAEVEKKIAPISPEQAEKIVDAQATWENFESDTVVGDLRSAILGAGALRATIGLELGKDNYGHISFGKVYSIENDPTRFGVPIRSELERQAAIADYWQQEWKRPSVDTAENSTEEEMPKEEFEPGPEVKAGLENAARVARKVEDKIDALIDPLGENQKLLNKLLEIREGMRIIVNQTADGDGSRWDELPHQLEQYRSLAEGQDTGVLLRNDEILATAVGELGEVKKQLDELKRSDEYLQADTPVTDRVKDVYSALDAARGDLNGMRAVELRVDPTWLRELRDGIDFLSEVKNRGGRLHDVPQPALVAPHETDAIGNIAFLRNKLADANRLLNKMQNK